jgi:class 3 adenylate cyclase/tetratricopeptide (TPR) repeat protein
MSSGPRRERKVITVVFADIVGFTERADQLDPEDVEAILQPYQDLLRTELERMGGNVEKFIGDAVMAVFGAPAAHEDDPERAVRAALAVRDRIREDGKLGVRIAVHTGEAIVRLDAHLAAGETIAAGDVLNTAARLEEAAPTNGVLVGEATYSATRHVFEYLEAEPVKAKGKAEPIPAWEAIRLSRPDVGVREASTTPLVGRGHELTLLRETLGRVESERSPQLVTLVGVPGIGKSRLVRELVQSDFQEHPLRSWRQGRCLPYGDGVSFWAIAEIVKQQAGILESDEPEVVAEKLLRAVSEAVEEDEAAWVRRQLSPLVGLEGETGIGSERREESFDAWRRFLEAVAEQRPLMTVIEDLHWADDGLIDFLDYLADWARGVPLLIVCTARPELLDRRPGWGGGKLNALTLRLSPLPDEEAARLIASVLDRAVLPAETQAELLERAGGNPLYAEQFALLYLERGSTHVPLPDNIHALIAARLDTLSPEEKGLLQDAAVIGRIFWSGALPARDDGLSDRLHALERKEFVRREQRSSVAGEDEYAFRHVLVRDVAYGQIPRAERARKHELAAAWIESLGRPQDHAEVLAHHYVAALELTTASGGDTRALAACARNALRDGGDRALSLNSFAAASGFYSSALDLTAGNDPERPLLLFRLGEARFNNEEAGDEILVEAAAALAEAGNLEAAAETEVMLSHIAWTRGLREEAFDHLERATTLIDELPPSFAKTRVLSQRTRHFMLVSGDRGLRAVIRLTRGDLEGALEDTARALELAQRSDDPHVIWGALSVRAWILSEAGDEAEAGALLDRLLADERTSSSGGFYRSHPLALWVAYVLGRADELVTWMRQKGVRPTRWLDAAEAFVAGDVVRVADIYGSLGHRPLEAFVRLRAARALAAEGRVTEAEAQLEQALSFFRSVDATRFVREGDALSAGLSAAS